MTKCPWINVISCYTNVSSENRNLTTYRERNEEKWVQWENKVIIHNDRLLAEARLYKHSIISFRIIF